MKGPSSPVVAAENSDGPSEGSGEAMLPAVPLNDESSTRATKSWGNITSAAGNQTKAASLASIMAQEEELAEKDRAQRDAQMRADQEERELLLAIQASLQKEDPSAVACLSQSAPVYHDTTAADHDEHGIDREIRQVIALSLKEQRIPESSADELAREASDAVPNASVEASATAEYGSNLSRKEAEEIERALREADEDEASRSLQLALQLQQEESVYSAAKQSSSSNHKLQGNVRILTRYDFLRQQQSSGSSSSRGVYIGADDCYEGHDSDSDDSVDAGFRMNSAKPSASWSRVDRSTIVGPNNEVRTKHDLTLQGQANAHRLGLNADEDRYAHVGNKAFNSFRQSMQKKTIKGVAAHGHGRATADTDKTRGGAMDPRVRLHITKAINNGLIEHCNGVIKEGKEALVYHAEKGVESGGFDVAVKVFKRIQEFKLRGMYVDGDPRYHDKKFTTAGSREQLELWAEKEYRNLVRAKRAGVPVPTPLLHKENVLFMRFLGDDGWPSPQLKELDMKRGSKKWTALYTQTMAAVKRLYQNAHLVHGDLSEYNVLVCPSRLVENREGGGAEYDENAVQIVLIDFGQAVDVRHPQSKELLQRDLLRLKEFFDKMGIKTMDSNAAKDFVMTPEDDERCYDHGKDSAEGVCDAQEIPSSEAGQEIGAALEQRHFPSEAHTNQQI